MFEQAVDSRLLLLAGKLFSIADIAERFYLAGGTALALHLGHRKSDDLDLFSEKKFSIEKLCKTIENLSGQILIAEQETIHANVEGMKLSTGEHCLSAGISCRVRCVAYRILDSILNCLGHLEAAYLIDDYALGRDTGVIDILLVGEIDPYHLADLTKKTERHLERKIRTLVFYREEFERLGPGMLKRPHVRLWE